MNDLIGSAGDPKRRRLNDLPPRMVAAAILLAGAAAAAGVAGWVETGNRNRIDDRFAATADDVAAQISERLSRYEYAVRGARGAIVSVGEDRIDRDIFHRYAITRDIEHEFPGLRGFGFVRRVPKGEEAAFVAMVRRRGHRDFSIKEIGANDGERWVIAYVEPIAYNARALGLDVASDRSRRQAAVAAMDSGAATITAPIELVQSPGVGFLLFLPIYRAGLPLSTIALRSKALTGWSYAPLTAKEVLAGFDSSGGDYQLRLADVSSSQARPIFTSAGFSQDRLPPAAARRTITVFGRRWGIELRAEPAFVAGLNLPSPAIAAAITFLVVLLSSGFVYYRVASSNRMLAAALSRARLAAIVEASGDAIILEGTDGLILDWNPAAENLFGFSRIDAMGRRLADLIAIGEFRSEEELKFRRALAGQATFKLSTRRLDHQRRKVEVLLDAAPIRSSDGTVMGVATTMRDIGEQRAAEEQIRILNSTLERQVQERTQELRKTSTLQTAILSYAGHAVIATDMDGTITLFNPAAEAMLGYRADELVAKSSPAVFHKVDEVADRAVALSAAFSTHIEPGFEVFVHRTKRGLPNNEVWTYVTREGREFPVQLNISPLRTPEGQNIGFLGIAVDLTAQRQREAELEIARKAAEQAAEAKAQFLATMSHELRTPLNSVIGFSRLMLESGELQTAQLVRQARLIQDSSRTLLSVVNDILDVSRLETGNFDLDPRPFFLRHVVLGTADMLRADAEAKGITLQVDLPDEPVAPLLGDDGRLRQILLNLMSNAIKFTAKGSVRVRVEAEDDEKDHVMLRFEVIDTGIGIPRHKQDRLFKRFSQADGSTSRLYGGSGLGLSICKSLVEIMGGAIGFSSEDGRGSSFWFTLGLPVAATSPLAEPVESEGGAARMLHILLAEDVDLNQEIAMSFLSKWGHTVDVVADGAAAVAAAQTADYDLILMDVQMPVMDGVAATRAIRRSAGRAATIPIIAMTANVMSDDISRFMEAGMNDHVGKPFDPARLRAVVEKWSDRPATGTSAPGERFEPAPDGLQDKYVQRLNRFVAEGSMIGSAGYAAAHLPRLKELVHQLAGSAGLFGDHDIGELAAALERHMRSSDIDTSKLVRLFNQLLALIDGRYAIAHQTPD